MSIRRWNSAPLEHVQSQSSSEAVPMIGGGTVEGEKTTVPSFDELPSDDKEEKLSDQYPSHHTTSTDVPSFMSNTKSSGQEIPTRSSACGYYGCGRGIVADYKRTVGKYWKEEMTNFNQKTIAVTFFLYFACIAPAITFGAIYAKATHNWIGAVEMLLATSWCGIVYALIGGQPMMINGGTGPVLAFAEILFKLSESLEVPFLTFNAWIGIWVSFYMCIAAFVDLNRIIVYATRFTDEIFALLIATIFIINALYSPFAPVGVFYYFDSDHKHHDEYEDDDGYSYIASALLSLLVCIGTVELAFILRKIKFSPFLPNQMARNTVTDFAVVFSIFIMTLIANGLFSSIELETLNVPDSFAPTYACCTETCEANWPNDCPEQSEPYGSRPWLVSLTDLNGKGWVPLMAAGPAILAFILVFLDNGITWHLINHPAYKLKHGQAYDYDTLILGLMIAINSLLGLPWLVAATVRSLNHVHALAEKSPSGKIESVQETRLTNLGIHLLCLASIFALGVLALIPMAVLYGVFLFMGLVSLGTNQFFGRILMFFMQPSKYPLEPYTVHMKPCRMHLFTLIQLGLFALLYTVKAIKSIAIAFPLVIASCIPVRLFILPRVFTQKELVVIDSDDDLIDAWLREHEEKEVPTVGDEEMQKVSREEDDDAHETYIGEERDQVGPLPDTLSGERRRTHRHRVKALSCPSTSNMLFDEVPLQVSEVELTASKGEERRRAHRRRIKTLSCPPHMLFAEVPFSATKVGVTLNMEEGSNVEEEEGDDSMLTREADVAGRPRRRRSKAISCPPHMLFAEAERHVASNYFFG